MVVRDRAATPPQRPTTAPLGGCQGHNRAGEPCGSFVPPGRTWCYMHDPERRIERQEAQAKGGAKSNKLRAIRGRRRKLDSAPALVAFTSGLVQDVIDGTLSPDIVRVALYGVSIQRALLEISDLDARLRALEQQVSQDTEGTQRPWRA